MIKRVLIVVLSLGVVANSYLAWQLHRRMPPSTEEIDRDLAMLPEEASVRSSEDFQVKAEQALAAAIRNQTREMLEQRRQAIFKFIDIRYTVNGVAAPLAAPAQLLELEEDINKQRALLEEYQKEIEEIQEGGVQSQRVARLRVLETNLALLERRYLSLKHGIVLPAAEAIGQAASVDKNAIGNLENDIANIRRVIEESQKEADAYSGGLIKTTLLYRLATEQTTLASLEQQYLSLKYGMPPAPGLLPVVANQVDPEVLAPLDADINKTKASIDEGKLEASLYSGGLVRALIISRVSTESLTLALLEQKRLAIKHGVFAAQSNPGKKEPKDFLGTVVNDKDAL